KSSTDMIPPRSRLRRFAAPCGGGIRALRRLGSAHECDHTAYRPLPPMIDSVRIASPDQALYPDCMPRASGMLRVDARHAMHWEECGNAAGVPLLFVHGGPGGGSLPHHRRY